MLLITAELRWGLKELQLIGSAKSNTTKSLTIKTTRICNKALIIYSSEPLITSIQHCTFYFQYLDRLRAEFCWKQPGLVNRQDIHHDNARPHDAVITSKKIMDFVCKLQNSVPVTNSETISF